MSLLKKNQNIKGADMSLLFISHHPSSQLFIIDVHKKPKETSSKLTIGCRVCACRQSITYCRQVTRSEYEEQSVIKQQTHWPFAAEVTVWYRYSIVYHPVEHVCQFSAKSVQSYSNYLIHKFGNG